MPTITDDPLFLSRLELHLLTLPSWREHKDRNDSWMTSKEIAKWYSDSGYSQYPPAEIEDYLLDKWKNKSLTNIRPAKYPNLINMQRLWGHTEKVYPQPEHLDPWKSDELQKLKKIAALPPDAPSAFLSHSQKDFDLAKQVRQTLGENYGVDTWLFESELNKDENIFGSVHLGLVHCDATMVLLTSNSIGSAWIHTEIVTAANTLNKKIITLTDAGDQALMLAVDSYLKNPEYSEDRLADILERYKQKEQNEHRIDEFKTNATNILNFLHLYSNFCVFPSIPDEYADSKFIDLKNALENVRHP
ncbi:MAG TPA: toll/interleukin-1 receptor domain-containing protein [Puia sp.]|jgi:hypothetical protein|nr:toll/interleukin-1 receptor domain-containing protein [Puia sp.]